MIACKTCVTTVNIIAQNVMDITIVLNVLKQMEV